MPKTRLFTRSVVRPINMTLNLECIEEPLSEVQLTSRTKLKENCKRVAATLEELAKDHGGKLICQSGGVCGYQYILPTGLQASIPPPPLSQPSAPPPVPPSAPPPPPPPVKPALVSSTSSLLKVNQNSTPPIKLNIDKTNGSQGNIQLVVNPRMGVILGSVTQSQATITTTTSATSTITQPQQDNFQYTRSGRKTKVLQIQEPDIIEEDATFSRLKPKPTTHVITQTTTSPQGITNLRINFNKQQVVSLPTIRPTEQTSIGGISIGKKIYEKIDESKKSQSDERDYVFNKTTGTRTFPSLMVVARPNLQRGNIVTQIAERSELDSKVKNVLMFSATKFTEWLIQQGLVKSEQYCIQHSTNDQQNKLKLGMFNDQGTFPYSGGYVWISACCPEKFVSVYSGSIFQQAPYTPTVLLKLVYHWACQTNVQNVISWVKVSNVYLKNFYTNLRSICTTVIWDKCRKMGGKNSTVQIGIISLGTTSQDGHLRQVKVEVLGVLDSTTLDLRLRAYEPMLDGTGKSHKRRLNNILSPLKEWVHTDSNIVIDFTINKATLNEMGYNNVTQSAFSELAPRSLTNNSHIMDYLRKIVPRMFQNTLSLLSTQMIQQFLDELIWRELYGTTAARAYQNIIVHMAEQTKINRNDSLLGRLAKIAADPFQDWSYSNAKTQIMPLMLPTQINNTIVQNNELPQPIPIKPNLKRGRKRIHSVPNSESEPKRIATDLLINTEREKENKNEKACKDYIQIQELYYATMEGDKNLILKECKSSIHFKCFLCNTIMKSNIEVMEHMINHVPPQVPGQSELSVCRYCCTALSSQHHMLIHVAETHSDFGHSDGVMVVCAICEQKFGKSKSFIEHLSSMHYPSEMPYRCESCGYRTSSQKDAIDHYYKIHEKGEGLQCPYCLKVMQFANKGNPYAPSIHAYLLHMQRHILRKDQGKGNKCTRCCLCFNQKSLLKIHQQELHDCITNTGKVTPYSVTENAIMIPKEQLQLIRCDIDSPSPESPPDEKLQKWSTGSITVNTSIDYLSCQECEEDITEENHYPGEQQCAQCRYVTCCWRAFKEHQQQIHNERPKTSLIVPSPLISIPLEKKLQCPCGYTSTDGNQLATHLIKCNRISAYPTEDSVSSGMLNSLGLVPKNPSDEIDEQDKTSSHN